MINLSKVIFRVEIDKVVIINNVIWNYKKDSFKTKKRLETCLTCLKNITTYNFLQIIYFSDPEKLLSNLYKHLSRIGYARHYEKVQNIPSIVFSILARQTVQPTCVLSFWTKWRPACCFCPIGIDLTDMFTGKLHEFPEVYQKLSFKAMAIKLKSHLFNHEAWVFHSEDIFEKGG